MKFNYLIIAIIFAAFIAKADDNNELDKLVNLMTGKFSSGEQSALDSSYFHITLKMYPIWTERDGKWLYVEQAVATMQDEPYRQRVYKLEQISDTEFASRVFSIESEERFIGKWAEPEFFDDFDESILSERIGCTVYLKKINENIYDGSTNGADCESSLREAKYATSRVFISKVGINSWDQGFNADNHQVWGATEGGYVFKRLSE